MSITLTNLRRLPGLVGGACMLIGLCLPCPVAGQVPERTVTSGRSQMPTVPASLTFEAFQGNAAHGTGVRQASAQQDSSQSDSYSQSDIGEAFEFPTAPSGLFAPSVATPPSNTQAETIRVPIPSQNGINPNLQIRSGPENVSIYAQGVDLRVVLAHLAEESKVNIVVAENVTATVTTTLSNVPLWDALDAILRINGLVWTRSGNIIFVTTPGTGTATPTQPQSQPGQQLQVFDLHYTSSEEALEVVRGLLSTGGKAFAHKVDINSRRQTRERLVVEDYPDRIEAISLYLAGIDNPPQQVLIEANVLQVTLDDEQRHGVNLLGLARLAGARINVRAQGFANADASPGFMMGLEGGDLSGMIEMLQANSDVRTLAAPKVFVVNGQQARIQIGSKFGYFVTTTTQTSTLQSVDFLDIGVVLQVEPTITRDGQILLAVEPKVSGGRINPDSGLPEEETTEAKTTVLLPNGKGMIIGGLIKESDDHKKTGVPWLGDQPFIGKLFSRTNDDVQRQEVIIALTAHIVPYGLHLDQREYQDFSQATATTAPEDYYISAPTYQHLPTTMSPSYPNFQQQTYQQPSFHQHNSHQQTFGGQQPPQSASPRQPVER